MLALLADWLAILNGLDAQTLFSGFLPGLTLDAIAFSTLGALVASHRPGHRIGWLLCAAGFGAGLEALAGEYARYGLLTHPGVLPGAPIAGWFASWGWVMVFALPIVFLLMLFPTGRLPSARWRPVAWLTIALMVAVMALIAVSPVLLQGGMRVANPFALQAMWPSEEVQQTIISALLVSGLLFGVSSVVVRFRRAVGVERQQLKWFVYAAVLILIGVDAGPTLLLQSVLTPDTLLYVNGVAGAIAFPCLAGAVAIAILRYRLYDIDLIIRRTLVYGGLTAVLAALYWASVVVLQQLLRPLTQGSDLAIVGSTLTVAALFQPLRHRIQRTVDRRFYRQRYDAVRTLEAFTARLRDEVDLDALGAELLGVVGQTLQPQRLSLWIRPPAGRRNGR
jgi:hypothetical protein